MKLLVLTLLAVVFTTTVAFITTPTDAQMSGQIRCRTGEFAHSCPPSRPVCCYDSSGYSVGCCPQMSVCDQNGNCVHGPPLPPNTTAADLAPIDTVVHVSWFAFILFIVCSVSFLILTSLLTCTFGIVKGYLARRRLEIRAAEIAAQIENNEYGSDIGSDDDIIDADPDVDSDDERNYRENVLVSRDAVLAEATATSAAQSGGVISRVAAWFSAPNTARGDGTAGRASAPMSLSATPRSARAPRRRGSTDDPHNSPGDAGRLYGTMSADGSSLQDHDDHDDHHHHNDDDDKNSCDFSARGPHSARAGGGDGDLTARLGGQMINDDDDATPQQQQQPPSSSRRPPNDESSEHSPLLAGSAAASQQLPEQDPTEKYLLNACGLCHVRLGNCALLPCQTCDLICEHCAKHMKRCPSCGVVIRKRVKVFVT